MKINVSIMGLWRYNPDVFKNLRLPAGVDPDILIPDLVSECSDFPLLYPDYDFMQMMIGVWSEKEQGIWEAMQRSVELEYNPIENYDRYENISRSVTGETSSESESAVTRKDDAEGSTIDSRTAFNSIEPREAARTESSTGTEGSTDSTGSSSGTSSGTETVESHMHGNIGVTTAAQMIEGFRQISDFSVYEFIINSFKARFCIQLY